MYFSKYNIHIWDQKHISISYQPGVKHHQVLYFQIFSNQFQAIWDWVILFLVIYTAIFTPYVAAFLLNEPGYSDRSTESYGSDPIVIIDLLGDRMQNIS